MKAPMSKKYREILKDPVSREAFLKLMLHPEILQKQGTVSISSSQHKDYDVKLIEA